MMYFVSMVLMVFLNTHVIIFIVKFLKVSYDLPSAQRLAFSEVSVPEYREPDTCESIKVLPTYG